MKILFNPMSINTCLGILFKGVYCDRLGYMRVENAEKRSKTVQNGQKQLKAVKHLKQVQKSQKPVINC